MKRNNTIFLSVFIILCTVTYGCALCQLSCEPYDEIPSMLNIVTSRAQIAVEEGVFDAGGQQAVIQYINDKNPNTLKWFDERNFQIKIGVISKNAVVMVCDNGKPVFEDTACNPGAPDRDHRKSSLTSCGFTLSKEDVMKICQQAQ